MFHVDQLEQLLNVYKEFKAEKDISRKQILYNQITDLIDALARASEEGSSTKYSKFLKIHADWEKENKLDAYAEHMDFSKITQIPELEEFFEKDLKDYDAKMHRQTPSQIKQLLDAYEDFKKIKNPKTPLEKNRKKVLYDKITKLIKALSDRGIQEVQSHSGRSKYSMFKGYYARLEEKNALDAFNERMDVSKITEIPELEDFINKYLNKTKNRPSSGHLKQS